MLRAMKTAVTGMNAQQILIDTIANNLANINTVGYKAQRATFRDLLYQTIKEPGRIVRLNYTAPIGIQLGCGTEVSAVERDFRKGRVLQTGNPLDVLIDGDGFFEVELPDGRIAYTRDGAFKLSADGLLVTSEGYPLLQRIYIPPEAESIIISKDGTVSVTYPDEVEPEVLGQIMLAKFVNPQGLKAIGENLYVETPASGKPIEGVPGEEGFGELRQFYLEMANVDIVKEMVNMIMAQRAFEIASRVITTSDRMFEITNRLVRA